MPRRYIFKQETSIPTRRHLKVSRIPNNRTPTPDHRSEPSLPKSNPATSQGTRSPLFHARNAMRSAEASAMLRVFWQVVVVQDSSGFERFASIR
jgi:hypothetical protein